MASYDSYLKMMANWSEVTDSIVAAAKASKAIDEYDRKLFNELFLGFTEITDTVDSLELIATLLNVAPPRSKKIDKGIYIKHLVGAYLQEVYILKERLNAYATKVSRLYSSNENKEFVELQVKPVFDLVSSSFRSVNLTRGSHVHGRRYSDKHLDAVSQMALISNFDSDYEFELKIDYYLAKKKWSQTVKNNNEETKKVLDSYFKSLSLVTSKNGKLIAPNKFKNEYASELARTPPKDVAPI